MNYIIERTNDQFRKSHWIVANKRICLQGPTWQSVFLKLTDVKTLGQIVQERNCLNISNLFISILS